MKENKTIKTTVIAVVSILIIAIIGLGIYAVFIKKDDSDIIDNNALKFSKIEKVELNENNKNITINGKTIKLKSMTEGDSIVYVNNEKAFSSDGPGKMYAYITNNLIAVYWEGSMWGNIIGYIDRDGRIMVSPVSTYPVSISNLYIENNKLMATRDYNGEMDCGIPENATECKPETKVELVYDGNTIEIKEVK